MTSSHVVIVGGGHAGAQVAASLRARDADIKISLVCGEQRLPYHRPPLSKAFLKSDDIQPQVIRAEAFYNQNLIDLIFDLATDVDLQREVVVLQSGREIRFDRLVLATGSSSRSFRPTHVEGLHQLRSISDAERLRGSFRKSESMVVLGGGLIGLEVTATAVKLGLRVDLFEPQPRLLNRVSSDVVSQFLASAHLKNGVRLHLGQMPSAFEVEGRWVVKSAEATVEADLLLAAIGGVANGSLAERAGLTVRSGVVVDQYLRTSDSRVFAVGDCAEFFDPVSRCHRRVETVQNANDQARHVAKAVCGTLEPYRSVPSFWSDQYAFKLQCVGAVDQADSHTSGVDGDRLRATHARDGELVAFEAINDPRSFAEATKTIMANGENVQRVRLEA